MSTAFWLKMILALGFGLVALFWLLYASGFWSAKPAPALKSYLVESPS